MKKLFTLLMVLCLVSTSQARQWNFRSWSDATWEALKASAAKSMSEGWSDVEKATATAPTEASKDNCFWQATIDKDDAGNITCEGVVIPELKGLYYTNGTARSLAIAVNYKVDDNYNGASYLWCGSSKKDYFIIPNVKPGTHIKMGVESHKVAESRGFELYLTNNKKASHAGTKLLNPDGVENTLPTTYQDFEWVVPVTATDVMNDDGTWDVQIYNTNGSHIYYITVEETIENPTLGYIYSGEATDPLKDKIEALGTYEVTAIDLAQNIPSTDEFQAYDVLVIDPATSTEYANVLYGQIPWQPVVNFNANMYPAWDLGDIAEPESELGLVYRYDNVLFDGVEINEEDSIQTFSVTNGEVLPVGLRLRGKYDGDTAYAIEYREEGASIAPCILIHGHNVGHNGYFYLPYSVDAILDIYEGAEPLIANTIAKAVDSKSKIIPTPAPTINVENGKLCATVTFSDVIANADIYYAIDGEPTIESTKYTEPIMLTSEVTVKAVAIAEGYTVSDIASVEVKMLDQAQVPQLTVVEQGNNLPTIITITTNEASPVEGESLDLWYNFTGDRDTTVSSKYTEPVEILQTTEAYTVYAFAKSASLVASETASAEVKANLDKPRRTVISHMDSSSEDWNGGSTGTKYYFSWGKSAKSAYIEDVDPETGEIIKMLKEPETFQPGTDDGTGTKTFENEMNADWQIKSYGQVMDWMKCTFAYVLHDASNYNSWKVFDQLQQNRELITKYVMQFGGKADGESANASIESVKKFQGPFNIVAFVGNGSKPGDDGITAGTTHTFEIAVATDTTSLENWQVIDSVKSPSVGRNWTTYERAYNGTDEVFVRIKQVLGGSSGYISDIYIMGPSEPIITGLKGDANEDGTVDVSDITTIASYILGSIPPTFNFDNADVDGDGEITVSDITGTAAIILGN
ncbi:MAG: chitobiase/beta-hexosaminidase C-terminal domain-containing protein [Prevotellaceae bacterium]|nr:chitobiase/beta-hexosaminidase C-terminal domain-containing protein [Prevotellaceae bacterium]